MDFFSVLTDPKVILIIVAVILLIGLAYYGWKQLTELKTNNEKMAEQVKHGLILSDKQGAPSLKLKLRPDMASNMSEETYPEGPEEDENQWNEEHDIATEGEEDADDPDQDISNEEHNAYIQELIRIQDSKRPADFYIKEQQQPGHHGPVYDSGEEEVIFDNYDDDQEDDEVSESELIAHAAAELASVKSEPTVVSPPVLLPPSQVQIKERVKPVIAPLPEPPVPQVVPPVVPKVATVTPVSENPKPFVEKLKPVIIGKPKPVIKGKAKAN
jgi:hypothetical protein